MQLFHHGIVVVFLVVLQGTSGLGLSDAFDCREATIESVHHALHHDLSSCRDIVSCFIARVEAFNPTINAIISLNPHALAVADQMDMQLKSGNMSGPLFCVPVLLKDNFDTVDMPTTGGCAALAGSQPTVDAPATAALRNAGAIILGKTNMHEMALEGISVSSLGGQTINPYDHTRTPGGSSGGTGAAVAMSFAVFGTGTDTMNSLRSPASANSLFSIRPTRGLLSRTGVIPLSYTQDAVGPIARTVKDLATALTVLSSTGPEILDNTTSVRNSSLLKIDYAANLRSVGLNGLRFGQVLGFFNNTDGPETTPVNNIMASMLARLTAAGATIIPIPSPIFNATALHSALDVQRYEYRTVLDQYLSRPSLHGPHPPSFSILYSSPKTSKDFLVLPSQYPFINACHSHSPSSPFYETTLTGIENLKSQLHAIFSENDLDAFIYPQQKNLVVSLGAPSQVGRNGILAALTGFPSVLVPAGFSEASESAPLGVPIGIEILGKPWSEERLLGAAAAVERLDVVGGGGGRKAPIFGSAVVEVPAYGSVPVVVPDVGNIPGEYPLGVF